MIKKGVLYFGSYDPNYSRNRIIKKGLRANTVLVLEANAQGLFFLRYLKLTRLFLAHRNKIQTILVGFPGHYDVLLAYILAKLFGKRVLYDVFASMYETYVMDRGVVNKNSTRAISFFWFDWIALKLADFVIIDTEAHGYFYKKLYKLKTIKTITIYQGSDTYYFYPKNVKDETDVLFYGSYQPLQGVQTIIEAASRLPKVKFKMIGEGQHRELAENLANNLKLKNIEFTNWVPLESLAAELRKAKLCLGIFGDSKKANLVVPNKVFDAIATKKPVITEKSAGIQEIFEDKKNIWLIPKKNSTALSKAVSVLLSHRNTRNKIATEAHKEFSCRFKPKLLVEPLLKYCS